ncbi:MAG: hypothetical protein J6O56_03900 [Bacilli bacterium]|nr:hypothetical protein [Bacilli bacterium]
MTQKELLYVEDAITHEGNVIKLCEDMVNTLEDEKLILFMDKQIKKHTNIKDKILNALEDKING